VYINIFPLIKSNIFFSDKIIDIFIHDKARDISLFDSCGLNAIKKRHLSHPLNKKVRIIRYKDPLNYQKRGFQSSFSMTYLFLEFLSTYHYIFSKKDT